MLPYGNDLPLRFLQEPWLLDANALAAAGVKLGTDYPARVVDHIEAARAAKIKLTAIRAEAGYKTEAAGVFIRHGSRKRPTSIRKSKAVNAKKVAPKQLTFDL